jgi:hypothetical protein
MALAHARLVDGGKYSVTTWHSPTRALEAKSKKNWSVPFQRMPRACARD